MSAAEAWAAWGRAVERAEADLLPAQRSAARSHMDRVREAWDSAAPKRAIHAATEAMVEAQYQADVTRLRARAQAAATLARSLRALRTAPLGQQELPL